MYYAKLGNNKNFHADSNAAALHPIVKDVWQYVVGDQAAT